MNLLTGLSDGTQPIHGGNVALSEEDPSGLYSVAVEQGMSNTSLLRTFDQLSNRRQSACMSIQWSSKQWPHQIDWDLLGGPNMQSIGGFPGFHGDQGRPEGVSS